MLEDFQYLYLHEGKQYLFPVTLDTALPKCILKYQVAEYFFNMKDKSKFLVTKKDLYGDDPRKSGMVFIDEAKWMDENEIT